ncbi:MAG: hypothetical protein HY619_05090 [Thaumarchaeota archaeon]|nr:hypothetical protein [Nitrososphaerota archaeon]
MEVAWFVGMIMAFASDTKLRIATRKDGGIRALVKEMNGCMDAMDLKGLQLLIRQHPKEAVVAANYVGKKYRYVVQSMVLEVLRGQ